MSSYTLRDLIVERLSFFTRVHQVPEEIRRHQMYSQIQRKHHPHVCGNYSQQVRGDFLQDAHAGVYGFLLYF